MSELSHSEEHTVLSALCRKDFGALTLCSLAPLTRSEVGGSVDYAPNGVTYHHHYKRKEMMCPLGLIAGTPLRLHRAIFQRMPFLLLASIFNET